MNVLQLDNSHSVPPAPVPLLDLVECTRRSDDPLYLRGYGNFVSKTLYPLSGTKVIKTLVKLLNRGMGRALVFVWQRRAKGASRFERGIWFLSEMGRKIPNLCSTGSYRCPAPSPACASLKSAEIKIAVLGTRQNIRPYCPVTQSDTLFSFS